MAPTEPDGSAPTPAGPGTSGAPFDVPKGPDATGAVPGGPSSPSSLPPRSPGAEEGQDSGPIPGVTPTTGRILQQRQKPDERRNAGGVAAASAAPLSEVTPGGNDYDSYDEEQSRASAPRLGWVLATIAVIVGVLVLVDLASGGGDDGPKLVQSDLDGPSQVEDARNGAPDESAESVETDDQEPVFIPADPTQGAEAGGDDSDGDGAGSGDGSIESGATDDETDDEDEDDEVEAAPTAEPAPTVAPPAPATAVPAGAGRTDVFGRTCDVNYSGCVSVASDVDCFNDEADGPAFAYEPVQVIGSDIYGLDIDGDGIGCNVAGVGAAVYLGSDQG